MATVKHVEELLNNMVERQNRFKKAQAERDVATMATVYLEEVTEHMYALSDLVEDEEYREALLNGALETKMELDKIYECIE